ncbi:MAG: excinuclease ABC subunit UvrB [Candidatus Woesearchaeota archaeon]
MSSYTLKKQRAVFPFVLETDLVPKGSQPQAIAALTSGFFKNNYKFQTLLGITGSGKTFTMAHVIHALQKPTLVLVHNKTLARQLYQEFKVLFPKNRVEYFVSYYDYYQPESYIPQRDLYIEKDAQINPKIEQMRLAATASLLSRSDVIVVSSVSCIYSVGNPEHYDALGFEIAVGQTLDRFTLLEQLIAMLYERNDTELAAGRFRVKGDVVDIIPGYSEHVIRVEFFGDSIESIMELDKTSGSVLRKLEYYYLFPARHFVIPEQQLHAALASIEEELNQRLPELGPLEAHRLRQRTMHDLEMIRETGFCKGIENYSRHFDGRKPGQTPYCLLDYFPDDFLLIIDESHQTIPQLHAMYEGDRQRKQNLIDFGFRLPSAYDNRPLRFDEFETHLQRCKTLFVSATPSKYELAHSKQVVEQIIRPTGLVDPPVFVRGTKGQIQDLEQELTAVIARGDRALVTTLTKKLAEELAEYLAHKGIKTRYLHSEIDTLERSEIIRQLRLGNFDVLVGINLLREGLDIPEVGFIAILDADKEGFLRDAKSLIQIIGRAARNANSSVVLYADTVTASMKKAIDETQRRRALQLAYNQEHGIVPVTIKKPIQEESFAIIKDIKHIPKAEIPALILQLEAEMKKAADALDFEKAIALRDKIAALKAR